MQIAAQFFQLLLRKDAYRISTARKDALYTQKNASDPRFEVVPQAVAVKRMYDYRDTG